MKIIHDFDNLIIKKIKSNTKKTIPFFIALTFTFTVISVAEIMNIGDTPDITNPGVIIIIVATELFCYLAIWIYIRKLLSRRS